MGDQLATSAEALRLFFTDDVYLVSGDEQVLTAAVPVQPAKPAADLPVAKPEVMPVQPAASAEISVVQPVIEPEIKAAVITEIPAVNIAASAVLKTAVIPEAAPVTTFKYLGKNLKNILILVNDRENEVSTERGRELLRNIVKALQLTANDFALLNYAGYENTKFDQLQAHFSCKLLLSFGAAPVQLGLDECEPYQITVKGAAQLIFSGNLDALAEDQQGKKTLWGSLKQIQ